MAPDVLANRNDAEGGEGNGVFKANDTFGRIQEGSKRPVVLDF